MKVKLHNVSKRYNRDWIIKDFSYEFLPGETYAVLGPNGSGKSTLLQMIAASITPTRGEIIYEHAGTAVGADDIFRYIGFSAPYLQLIEEFTFVEQLVFHQKFRLFYNKTDVGDMLRLSGLEAHRHKYIKYFSSGMKQRVKLLLSILSDAPLILLDEPLTNMDKAGKEWYLNLIGSYTPGRTVIVCSNRAEEYGFCRHQIDIASIE